MCRSGEKNTVHLLPNHAEAGIIDKINHYRKRSRFFMSIQNLQELIRAKKTPLALGICPEEDRLPQRVLKNFTDMYGESPMAKSETVRYLGCQLLDAAAEKLPAVMIRAESCLRYGTMGFDVLINLIGIAHNRGMYTILDCRTGDPAAWLAAVPAADAVTVMPYVGGDCCAVPEDKAAFAVLRTANPSAGDVQNLMAGDRRLYLAAAEQMSRRGAAALIETGYSLDIKELRRRMNKTFLLLTHCDADNALPAFDEYGHGALVVDDAIQYAADPAAAVDEAIAAMKQVVPVV
jgi:orotidine-5'-phosphate decarboxylase